MAEKNTTENTTACIDARLLKILEQHNGNKLIDILDEQQPCLIEHQKRVACMATKVAREMHLSPGQEESIYVAASLHDIGMQQFTVSNIATEYNRLKMMERFKKHPEIGAELVRELTLSVPVDQIILQHHERLDGSGFPNSIKDVMIEAQIIAVVDIVDGVYSIHTNKPDAGLIYGCIEIDKMRGLLDSDVIDITIDLAKGSKLYEGCD